MTCSSSVVIVLLLPLMFSTAVNTCEDQETKITISITPSASSNGDSTDTEPERSNGCSVIGSNQYYACQTLKDGLELMSSIGNNCIWFTVNLEPGTVHVIVWPVTVNASVHMTSAQQSSNATLLQGSPNRALIRCGFDGDIARELTGGLHSLYFNGSLSVSFSDIDFTNFPLPIRIYQSNNVTVTDSSFRYFSEAVLDIHNSIDVTVNSCIFSDNYGTGIIYEPYRGNTGGLSITYNNLNINTTTRNPSVYVSNCNFTNNSAVPDTNFNTDQILSEGILTGRGGGMAVFVRENHFIVRAVIRDCYYSRNMAASYGGGLYLLFRDTVRHVITVENNVFESNRGNLGGAGVIVYTIGYHSYTFRNCTFRDNTGNRGVGLLYSTQIQTTILIDGCVFDGNRFLDNTQESFGAALAVYLLENFEQRSSITSNRIQDSSFINNVGESSIVSIVFESLEFTGTNIFINNSGTALRLFGESSTLSGRMDFINNQALDGAAIQVLSFSQLLLSDGLQLFFSGNVGRFGACITVSGSPSTRTFRNLLHNPTCPFILKTQPFTPPTLWHTRGINITFTKNSALFGSAIFMSSLMPCSWVNGYEFDIKYFPMWPVFHIREDNINSGVSDSQNQSYSVTSDPSITVLESTGSTTIWPGRFENLLIYSIDELGNPTGSITRLSFSGAPTNNTTNEDNSVPDVHIHPNAVLVKKERYPIDFSYTFGRGTDEINELVGEITASISGVLVLSQESNGTSIPLTGTHCAGGFVETSISSSNHQFSCQCDNTVDKILLCEEDQDSILIQSGQWASVRDVVSGEMFFYSCPLGYCRCFLNTSLGSDSCFNVFVNSDPNRQCVCGREGILCGECSSGFGVTVLLNVCSSSCSDGNVTVIPFLIIISAVVMIIIILIDKPLPQWCHPVTFTLQVAPIMALQFSFSFIVAIRFEIYVASFLSFYFPYDFCLLNEMKSLGSFGLRYIPALTALVFIPLAIVIRHFLRTHFLVFKLRSFKGHGIWTIVLLVYTLTAYTSLSILNCPMLPDSNGVMSPRWYIDGSVKCFEGGHIPLALVAILCLLLQILMIPLALLIGYKTAVVRRYFIGLGPIDEMLKASFKTNFEYWYAIELFRRLLIVFIINITPTNTSLVLLIIMSLVMIYGYWKPYKSRVVNYLELGLLMVFLTLLALKINPFFQDSLASIVNTDRSRSIPDCDTGAVGFTGLSILLSVIYYIPLLVGIACLITWISHKLYLKKMRQPMKKKRNQEHEMNNIVFMLSDESPHTPINIHSTSEVTINNE